MSDVTHLPPVAPGHVRHFIYPVYLDDRGFYGCLTEIWETDAAGHVTSYRVIEDYPQDELLQIAGLVTDGCNHGLVSWEYYGNGIAQDLYFTLSEIEDQVPTLDLDPVDLRAELESTIDQILGRG
jgi:hypothetical protein